MKPLLILQPGEKLPALAKCPGDFADWARKGMNVDAANTRVIYPHRDETLPELANARAVVVTGSSAMVTDRAPWVDRCAAWLREATSARLPVLGICFGHQLLAHALGGKVRDNPRGTEVGTLPVRLSAEGVRNPLFNGVPAEVHLHLSHRQTVSLLPPNAVRLANSDLDANQAFVVGNNAWGVQFHPEFNATIVAAYLSYHGAELRARGGDPTVLGHSIQDSRYGRTILGNFATLAGLASRE